MRRKRRMLAVLLTALLALPLCAQAQAALTLPADIKTIGAQAFEGTQSFDEAIVPEGATHIGARAFAGSALARIALPQSVEYIAEDAFADAPQGLVACVVQGSYAHTRCEELGIAVEYETPAAYFTYRVDNGDSGAGHVTITGWQGPDAWENLAIPAKIEGYPVTEIANYAFSGCAGFSGKLTFPQSLESIGGQAFFGCTGFTGDLIIPDSVTKIGDGAFVRCSGFDGCLAINGPVKEIESAAFYLCSGLTGRLIIPYGVTMIGYQAFEGCEGFTGDLFIPDSVTLMEDQIFKGCAKLESVVIGGGVSSVIYETFADCTALKAVWIPTGVTEIESSVFDGISKAQLTIHGESGSYAQTFAQNRGYTFSTERFFVE